MVNIGFGFDDIGGCKHLAHAWVVLLSNMLGAMHGVCKSHLAWLGLTYQTLPDLACLDFDLQARSKQRKRQR